MYPDLAIDKFSGADTDQDAETFIQLIERKTNSAIDDAFADTGELANYTFRKKTLFSSLLQGHTADWFENIIINNTNCDIVQTNFITRISDGRDSFRYRMEHCISCDEEEIRHFIHRIRRTVDERWPNDFNGTKSAQQNAERHVQARQREQNFVYYSLKELRPRYLERKALDYLLENPNATWNDFSNRIKHRDVSFQVSSNFLKDEEQLKNQMGTLE